MFPLYKLCVCVCVCVCSVYMCDVDGGDVVEVVQGQNVLLQQNIFDK